MNKIISMRILADLGVILCLIICVWLWQAISRHQPMWPAPALYLIELAVLSLAGWLGIRRSETDQSSAGLWLTWAVAGAFAAFAGLGVWSIGFYEEQARWIIEAYQWAEQQPWIGPMVLYNLDHDLTRPEVERTYFSIIGQPA